MPKQQAVYIFLSYNCNIRIYGKIYQKTCKLCKKMDKSSYFIVGKHSVIEALKNDRRKVLKIFLTEKVKKQFIEKAQKKIYLKI